MTLMRLLEILFQRHDQVIEIPLIEDLDHKFNNISFII